MKKYVIRKRATGQYVDRSQRLPQDPEQALIFGSIEEADFYRIQLRNAQDHYEICELKEDGKVIPVAVS